MYEASERALVLMRVDFGRHLTRKKKEKTSGGRLDPSVRSIRWQQIENKKFTTKGHWKKHRAALRESFIFVELDNRFFLFTTSLRLFYFYVSTHTKKRDNHFFHHLICLFFCFLHCRQRAGMMATRSCAFISMWIPSRHRSPFLLSLVCSEFPFLSSTSLKCVKRRRYFAFKYPKHCATLESSVLHCKVFVPFFLFRHFFLFGDERELCCI